MTAVESIQHFQGNHATNNCYVPYTPWCPTPQPYIVWPSTNWIIYNNDVSKEKLEALEKRVAELEAKLAKKRTKEAAK